MDEQKRERHREAVRRWRQRHHTEVLERERAHREKNREWWREYRRKWRLANPEKQRASIAKWRSSEHGKQKVRQWQAANRDKQSAADKRFRLAHPDKARAKAARRQLLFPEKIVAMSAKRRARKRELPCNWSTADMRPALAYWNDQCAVCDVPFGLLVKVAWDHWIPLTDANCPGTTCDNMVPLCSSCNASKSDCDPLAWLSRCFPKQAKRIAQAVASYFSQTTQESK